MSMLIRNEQNHSSQKSGIGSLILGFRSWVLGPVQLNNYENV